MSSLSNIKYKQNWIIAIGSQLILMPIGYFIFHPVDGKVYSGLINGLFLGGWHGVLAIPNFFISLFVGQGYHCFAEDNSKLYEFFWYFGLTSNLLTLGSTLTAEPKIKFQKDPIE